MGREGPQVEITVVQGDSGVDTQIDLTDRLISFEFEDDSEKADRCVIRLDNYDLAMIDDPNWRRGQLIQVSWGYDGEMSTPQLMVVKRIHGGVVLNVEGVAQSVLMNGIQRTRAWNNITRSAVVEKVAADHDFLTGTLDITATTESFETINQAGETDAAFLKRLARKENFIFWVDAAGLHWGPESFDDAPTHVLTYFTDPKRGEILDFNLDSDLFNAPGKVTVKGRNPKTKQLFEVEASDSETKYTDLGEELEVVDERTGTTTIQKRMVHEQVVHTSAADEEAAKKEADARFKKAAQEKIRLKLEVIGDPTLAAKKVVEVAGLGDYLSGKYFIRKATHKIADGYTASLDLKRGTAAKVPGTGAPKSDADKNNRDAESASELIEVVDERTGESSYERRG